jgi:hypothetical protein
MMCPVCKEESPIIVKRITVQHIILSTVFGEEDIGVPTQTERVMCLECAEKEPRK